MNDSPPRGGVAQLRAATAPAVDEQRSEKSSRRTPPPKAGGTQAKPPSPTAEPQKRSRGRPAVGKATKIRLGDSQEKFALQLGEGNLAEGVRRALEFYQGRIPGAKEAAAAPDLESVLLSKALVERVKNFGSSTSKGIETLLSVADSLGREAVRRLAGDSDGPRRKG